MLSGKERRYIERTGIDPEHVGRKIGAGAQSSVYLFRPPGADGDRVIKIPAGVLGRQEQRIVDALIGQRYDAACRALELCQRHFEPYAVSTSIRASKTREEFCILQDKVPHTTLTPQDCAEQSVRAQLEDLIGRNRDMMGKTGLWLDVMGLDAWEMARMRPYLKNIVVADESCKRGAPKKRLRVFDFGLFPLPRQRTFRDLYFRLLLACQRRNMEGYGLRFD